MQAPHAPEVSCVLGAAEHLEKVWTDLGDNNPLRARSSCAWSSGLARSGRRARLDHRSVDEGFAGEEEREAATSSGHLLRAVSRHGGRVEASLVAWQLCAGISLPRRRKRPPRTGIPERSYSFGGSLQMVWSVRDATVRGSVPYLAPEQRCRSRPRARPSRASGTASPDGYGGAPWTRHLLVRVAALEHHYADAIRWAGALGQRTNRDLLWPVVEAVTEEVSWLVHSVDHDHRARGTV